MNFEDQTYLEIIYDRLLDSFNECLELSEFNELKSLLQTLELTKSRVFLVKELTERLVDIFNTKSNNYKEKINNLDNRLQNCKKIRSEIELELETGINELKSFQIKHSKLLEENKLYKIKLYNLIAVNEGLIVENKVIEKFNKENKKNLDYIEELQKKINTITEKSSKLDSTEIHLGVRKLIKEQIDIANKIENIEVNYRKLNLNRRTEEGVRKKREQLLEWWKRFTEIENSLYSADSSTIEDLEEHDRVENQYIKSLKFLDLRIQEFQSYQATTMAPQMEKIISSVNKNIPIFDGTSNRDIHSSLANFIECSSALYEIYTAQEDREYFLKYLKTRLTGDARELVSQANYENMEELEEILRAAYVPKITYTEMKEILMSTRQRPGEDIFEYGGRVQRILAKCKEGIRNRYKAMADVSLLLLDEEKFAVQIFKSNLLNDALVFRLVNIEVTTLREIIEKAVVYEAENKQFGNRFEHNFKPKIDDITCHFCNKKGHVMQSCFSYLNMQNNQFSPGRLQHSNNRFHSPGSNDQFFNDSNRYVNDQNQYSNNSRFNRNYSNIRHPNNVRLNQQFDNRPNMNFNGARGSNNYEFRQRAREDFNREPQNIRRNPVNFVSENVSQHVRMTEIGSDVLGLHCDCCLQSSHETEQCPRLGGIMKKLKLTSGNGSEQSMNTLAAQDM